MEQNVSIVPELPVVNTDLPGPKALEVIARDRRVVTPSYARPYPFVAKRGRGAMVQDVDGNWFLDLNAGIAVVATGHCHPQVVRAIQQQAAELIHMSGTDFYYEQLAELGEKLVARAPGAGQWKVIYQNSGTEAIEAALKLARYATRREKVIAFYGAFHGRTYGALSVTASKAVQKKGFGPFLPGVIHVPYAYCYRCPFGTTAERCATECVRYIEEYVFKKIAAPEEVAAILFEPVQGEGGYIFPPKKFFTELATLAHRHGILVIADEVQSGMGRTGRWWAVEHFEITPDIIAIAKGIASGMPLGVTMAKARLMTWEPGAHATTFGGNPVSIAAALATIELLENGLIENASRIGQLILERLKTWPERFPCIGEVQGLGLMIGIEFVTDRSTKGKAPDLRDRVIQMAFKKGLLTLGAGENRLRLSPPLVINERQAHFAIEVLEECIATVSKE